MSAMFAKVIVCGGRDYRDQSAVWAALSSINPTVVAQGGCDTGADLYARVWAQHNDKILKTYPANWGESGRSAGPKRNQYMLDAEQPDAVIAFPGGRGTADMVRRARKAKVLVIEPVVVPAT